MNVFQYKMWNTSKSKNRKKDKKEEKSHKVPEIPLELPFTPSPSPIIAYLCSQKYGILDVSTSQKITKLLEALNYGKINEITIRTLSFDGIPSECKGLRHSIWKLLLGFWPWKHEEWVNESERRKKEYEELIREYINIPQAAGERDDDSSKIDHPLCLSKESEWNKYFIDREMWENINKDVLRTRKEINFFGGENRALGIGKKYTGQFVNEKAKILSKSSPNLLREEESKESGDNIEESPPHGYILCRMLFIFARSNPHIAYVQGMNEIIAVLYYSFYIDSIPLLINYQESDTYFCFQLLISELSKNYVRTVGRDEGGIADTLLEVENVLNLVDNELSVRITELGVKYEFFALRWVLLLFSQEFAIREVFRIWDSLFADTNRFRFLYYLSVGMILTVKKEVMKGDFALGMQALQHANVMVVQNGAEDRNRLEGWLHRMSEIYTECERGVVGQGYKGKKGKKVNKREEKEEAILDPRDLDLNEFMI